MELRVVFYLSAHGFGHATRMIAIIRELLSQADLEIFVKTNVPKWLFMNSLSERYEAKIEIVHQECDVGVIYTSGFLIDILETSKVIRQMVATEKTFLNEEHRFCRNNNIQLVICDIPPLPFLVANKLNIPCVGISNFNWYDIYEYLYQKEEHGDLLGVLKKISSYYELADLLLELPFATSNESFSEKLSVPLVVRKRTRQPDNIKETLNIEPHQKLIFVSLGWHEFKETIRKMFFDVTYLKDSKNVFLLSSNLRKFVEPQKYIRFIPSEDPNSQDYVAACDLVISKLGYGIVSECVANGIPMIYTIRSNYIEDILMGQQLETFNTAKFLPPERFLRGDWLNMIEEAVKLKNIAQHVHIDLNGAEKCSQYLMQYLE